MTLLICTTSLTSVLRDETTNVHEVRFNPEPSVSEPCSVISGGEEFFSLGARLACFNDFNPLYFSDR